MISGVASFWVVCANAVRLIFDTDALVNYIRAIEVLPFQTSC